MALGARLQCATSRPANPHAMQNTATRPTGYSPPTHRWHVPPSASRHPHTSHLVAVDDARDRFDLVGLRHAERRGLSLETCELCGLVVLIVLVAPPPGSGTGLSAKAGTPSTVTLPPRLSARRAPSACGVQGRTPRTRFSSACHGSCGNGPCSPCRPCCRSGTAAARTSRTCSATNRRPGRPCRQMQRGGASRNRAFDPPPAGR